MKAPYYKISVADSGRDLTDFVTSLKLSRSTEKDDMLTLVLKDVDPFLPDDDDFVEGKRLNYIFGLIGTDISRKGSAKISNIKTSYASLVTLTIDLLDQGQQMKRNSSNKVWNTTLGDLASEIAGKHELTAEVASAASSIKLDNTPQAGLSDFQFLKMKVESTGDFMMYVKDDKLVIAAIDDEVKKESRVTFSYGNDQRILSFTPTQNSTDKEGASDEVVVTSVDPKTKKTVVAKADATEGASTGKEGVVYSANGERLTPNTEAVEAESVPEETGKQIPSADVEKSQNKSKAKGAQKGKALSNLTADLVIDGYPALDAGDVISIKGVANKYAGNWYVVEVIDNIGGAYKTTLKLNKNGTNKSVQETSTATDSDVNNTTGPDDARTDVEITSVQYDANGVRV